MKKNFKIIYLQFAENMFYKGDILNTCGGVRLKILRTPHKTWWRKLLRKITFGIYKFPINYKCKLI